MRRVHKMVRMFPVVLALVVFYLGLAYPAVVQAEVTADAARAG